MTGAVDLADLTGIYRDLHAHPELAFAEHRTAGIVAARLRDLGYQTTTGVGGTGVVGLLANGDGPTVLLRADMDALPVLERTGLDYASADRGKSADGKDVPVMHACGHDAHVTCLLGAAAELAADASGWSGTLLLVFQPAEEVGEGAQAMIDDGLFDRFGLPDVVLGQHVAPIPAGLLGVRSGPAFAAADSLRIVLHGQGGHGSRPETTIDPVLMAAAVVQRLQGIVARELPAADAAVVTVGALHAGTVSNVIPDEAELLVSVRTFDQGVRGKVLAAIERIVTAEAAASGAVVAPEITSLGAFPLVVNDPAACARVSDAFAARDRARAGARPGPGDRKRGRRAARHRVRRALRLLAARLRRPGAVRRDHVARGGQGDRRDPAVQPLAAVRADHRADPAYRGRGADERGPRLAGPGRALAVRGQPLGRVRLGQVEAEPRDVAGLVAVYPPVAVPGDGGKGGEPVPSAAASPLATLIYDLNPGVIVRIERDPHRERSGRPPGTAVHDGVGRQLRRDQNEVVRQRAAVGDRGQVRAYLADLLDRPEVGTLERGRPRSACLVHPGSLLPGRPIPPWLFWQIYIGIPGQTGWRPAFSRFIHWF